MTVSNTNNASVVRASVSPAPDNGSYRVITDANGTFLQLWNPTQGKWHTVFVQGAAGAEQLVLGPPAS